MLEPLTPLAEAWLRANVSREATWNGNSLVIEMRYFPTLADAIIAAGFSFERNALYQVAMIMTHAPIGAFRWI
jgi:hypothetical protein